MLTFPLSFETFFAQLLISDIRFDSPEAVEMTQTGGGDILTAELGPMLWRGTATIGVMTDGEDRHPDVMLDVLRPPGRTFYAADVRRLTPLADPFGIILGNASPVIASLPGSNREMSVSGLPGYYLLSAGDLIAFDYGSGRRALHKIVSTVQASAAGLSPVFEVTPRLRAGANTGTAVMLRNPACKARLVPGSVDKGRSRQTRVEGMTFQFIQTLR